MTSIPLGRGAYLRTVAQMPEVRVQNRYFEEDPTNRVDEVALLTRPALRRWIVDMGIGPIRGIYSQPGTFSESLFAVSGDDLYKVEIDETTTNVGTIGSTSSESAVSFAATDDPFLFLCDGGILWLYVEDGFAGGTLTASGAIANGDVVKIDTIYYQWTTGSVDTGTPAGTLANPWLVALGADNTAALANIRSAVNDTGTPGTTYSTALVAHTTVIAITSSATTLGVRAVTGGTGGNSISTTETGANIAWGGATLSGGGSSGLTQVLTPDDVPILSVGYIASFVICVVGSGQDSQTNGLFYWIEPFQTIIDPLNFATAEQAPDPLWSVNVVGDQFWLPGSNSTEIWYPTGDELIPFLRVQSRVAMQGQWEGTALVVQNTVVFVGRDGKVYAAAGGAGEPTRVSNHGIEERIRQAMNAEIQAGP